MCKPQKRRTKLAGDTTYAATISYEVYRTDFAFKTINVSDFES